MKRLKEGTQEYERAKKALDDACSGATCECMKDYPVNPEKVIVVSDSYFRAKYIKGRNERDNSNPEG